MCRGMGFRFERVLRVVVAMAGGAGGGGELSSQQPVTRVDAVDAAITHGPRLAVARADTAVALAQLLTARALPDPTVAASYTKDVPQYHASLDVPIDFPWLRGARIGSAVAARIAARYRFTFARAIAALDADTTYTRAVAAGAHADLSRRNARDADTLRRMAVVRRDAGDASELDVELATVNAGQQANVAAADSLTYVSLLFDLQTVMGIPSDSVEVVPTDSLVVPADLDGDGATPPTPTLEVAAAEEALSSATLAARLQHRSVWGAPSLTVGFDTHDPGATGNALLPLFGVAIPLPVFGRNRGAIAQAEAELVRARAELALARVEGAARIARARRERDIALAKVRRDRILLTSANRVAVMSLTAYREGESSLPNVLEAQRNAREVLGQYIDDVAQAWIATAALRVFTLTVQASAAR